MNVLHNQLSYLSRKRSLFLYFRSLCGTKRWSYFFLLDGVGCKFHTRALYNLLYSDQKEVSWPPILIINGINTFEGQGIIAIFLQFKLYDLAFYSELIGLSIHTYTIYFGVWGGRWEQEMITIGDLFFITGTSGSHMEKLHCNSIYACRQGRRGRIKWRQILAYCLWYPVKPFELNTTEIHFCRQPGKHTPRGKKNNLKKNHGIYKTK